MAQVVNYVLGHTLNSQTHHLPFGIHLHLGPLTSHGLMLIVAGIILVLLFTVVYQRQQAVPTGITNLLETFLVFIRDQIAIPGMGEHDGRRYAPFLATLFFYILTLNLMGLVPLFTGATANINVTAGYALIILTLMVGGGIARHGPIGFVKSFAPHGVPWPLLLLLVPLEMVGMVTKCVALTIRLFANMMAGHLMLGLMVGMVAAFGWFGAPALAMALGVFLLKIFVCLLQAYIFTILSATFIGQVWHPAH